MLPGLTPAHTRKSYHSSRSPESTGSRLYIENIAPAVSDFIVSPETGLWLLPVSVAEMDTEKDMVRADHLATRLRGEGNGAEFAALFEQLYRALGRSSIGELGCVTHGLRGKQTPAEMCIKIANFEMGTVTHTATEEIPYQSLCGNPDCYNARHHHVEFRNAKCVSKFVELIPDWYRETVSGSIVTIWGDVLPPVQTSLEYFINFQRMNYPFVPYAESKLTATPVSQLAFHPLTGCWEAYLYETNSANLANIKNGYGVMYSRKEPDIVDSETGEIIPGYRRGSSIAHNIVWAASGRDLDLELQRNHLCNYTRCCNPLHIEQITPNDNRMHGQRARAIIRKQEALKPGTKGEMLSKANLHELYLPIRELYTELTSVV